MRSEQELADNTGGIHCVDNWTWVDTSLGLLDSERNVEDIAENCDVVINPTSMEAFNFQSSAVSLAGICLMQDSNTIVHLGTNRDRSLVDNTIFSVLMNKIMVKYTAYNTMLDYTKLLHDKVNESWYSVAVEQKKVKG